MQPAPLISSSISNPDYSRFLLENGLDWKEDGYYLICGEMGDAYSQRIYVSVVVSQIPSLLERLVPMLAKLGFAFAVVKDERSAGLILNGVAGVQHVGKVLMVWGGQNLESDIAFLAPIISVFDGPLVPGKKGIAKNIYVDPAAGELKVNNYSTQVLAGKYVLVSSLKNDPKGEVLRGLYLSKFLMPRWCIVKEGKAFMISDAAGKDMADRMKWQLEISRRLSDVIAIPKIIDFFRADGNTYLITQCINGKPLGRVIEEIYCGKEWLALKVDEKKNLLSLASRVLEMVGKVHENGLVHRDLSTANFLVDKKGELYLIDWELAFDLKNEYPLPPFGFGTPGFISPEQSLGQRPTVKEDIYGLSALMIALFTGLKPKELTDEGKKTIEDFMMKKTNDREVAKMIADGINSNPARRPELLDMKVVVDNFWFVLANIVAIKGN